MDNISQNWADLTDQLLSDEFAFQAAVQALDERRRYNLSTLIQKLEREKELIGRWHQ